jgi:hypothetical protein
MGVPLKPGLGRAVDGERVGDGVVDGAEGEPELVGLEAEFDGVGAGVGIGQGDGGVQVAEDAFRVVADEEDGQKGAAFEGFGLVAGVGRGGVGRGWPAEARRAPGGGGSPDHRKAPSARGREMEVGGPV